jgi:hypothetical protein
MKKRIILLITCILLVALVGGDLFAQSTARGRQRGSKTYDITVTANVKDAKVFVDGKEVGTVPYTGKLEAGDRIIKVTATGYIDYETTITVSKAATVNATLELKPVSVKISANVTAALTLDGKSKGNTPKTLQLKPGKYNILLKATGYKDKSAAITVGMKSSQEFKYTLDPATVPINITVTNVKGAAIKLNGTKLGTTGSKGNQTSSSVKKLPGKYSIEMSAPGYKTLKKSVTVPAAGGSYKYTLQEADAVLQLTLPDAYLNPDMGKGADARSMVKIYVDGKLMNAAGAVGDIKVKPGNHEVRIVSGGLSVAKTFTFKGGKTVNIQLNMSLSVP